MGWSAQYFTTIIIEGSSPQTGIFIYAGAPALNTLIGSWAAQAGTDAFGNSYPSGINVNAGQLTGVTLTNVTATAMTILSSVMSNSTINNTTINQGQINETTIIFDSGGGVLFGYTSTSSTTTITTVGQNNFTAPAGSYTAGSVSCWGSGTGGDGGSTSAGGGGGGGGGFGQNPNYPLTPGNVYTVNIAAGGTGNVTGGGLGSAGQDTTFDTGSPNGGVTGPGAPGGTTGGSGTSNPVNHTGGNGGAPSANTGGGSGGNSANQSATNGTGNSGTSSTSSTGAAAPAAQTGSGTGGAGGNNNANGNNGANPGGGGGGAGAGTGSSTNLQISYHPTWVASYYGPDANAGAPPNGNRTNATLYQGGETASGGAFNGNQRSLLRFNSAQIQSDFAGALAINSCTLTITNQHAWYSSGIYVELDYLQTPVGASRPGSFPTGNTIVLACNGKIQPAGQSGTFNLQGFHNVGNGFVGGSIDTLVIGGNVHTNYPYNLGYYGYFSTSATLTINAQMAAGGSTTAGTGGNGQCTITTASSNTLAFSLAPQSGTDSFGNAGAAGYTGPVSAFQPGSSPTVVETWHNMSLSNGWVAQSTSPNSAQYKLLPDNTVMVRIQINDSSATSGTFWSPPSGYIPANTGFFAGIKFLNANPNAAADIQIGATFSILNWAKQSSQWHACFIYPLD